MLIYEDATEGRGYYSDLVSHVSKLGHNITVIAPSTDGKPGLREEAGIRVIRVKTGKLFEVHPIIKGISNLRLPANFASAYNKYLANESFDWVVSPTPPITLAPFVKKLKRKLGCKSYLVLRDIFPQNARDLGYIRNPFIFNFFRSKEKKLYDMADVIGCMSQGNVDYVCKHNPHIDPNKVGILYNWIGFDDQHMVEPEQREDVRKEFGIAGKFVALFGGNLGRPQKIDSIIDLAKTVRDTHPDILFVLIGNGTERGRIQSLIETCKLSNVQLWDFLPKNDYLRLASVCDIGLVNLSDLSTTPNIPLRTFAYWASKLPVLACVDAATDVGKIIERENGGYWSVTGNLDNYRENLLKLYEDDANRREMGESGRRSVEQKYKTDVIAREFVRQLEEVAAK